MIYRCQMIEPTCVVLDATSNIVKHNIDRAQARHAREAPNERPFYKCYIFFSWFKGMIRPYTTEEFRAYSDAEPNFKKNELENNMKKIQFNLTELFGILRHFRKYSVSDVLHRANMLKCLKMPFSFWNRDIREPRFSQPKCCEKQLQKLPNQTAAQESGRTPSGRPKKKDHEHDLSFAKPPQSFQLPLKAIIRCV